MLLIFINFLLIGLICSNSSTETSSATNSVKKLFNIFKSYVTIKCDDKIMDWNCKNNNTLFNSFDKKSKYYINSKNKIGFLKQVSNKEWLMENGSSKNLRKKRSSDYDYLIPGKTGEMESIKFRNLWQRVGGRFRYGTGRFENDNKEVIDDIDDNEAEIPAVTTIEPPKPPQVYRNPKETRWIPGGIPTVIPQYTAKFVFNANYGGNFGFTFGGGFESGDANKFGLGWMQNFLGFGQQNKALATNVDQVPPPYNKYKNSWSDYYWSG